MCVVVTSMNIFYEYRFRVYYLIITCKIQYNYIFSIDGHTNYNNKITIKLLSNSYFIF